MLSRSLVSASALAGCLALSSTASGSGPDRLAGHVDLGAGTLITPELRRAGGFDLALHANARLAVTLVRPLTVQAGLAVWMLPSQSGDAALVDPFLGLGLDLPLASTLRVVATANGGAAFSGGLPHAMLDASLALEIEPIPGFALGPYVRFGHAFAREPEIPIDANMWSAGVAISLRAAQRVAPTPSPPATLVRAIDSDDDGIADTRDRCPRVPRGRTPDPERVGCPDGDIDRDGVPDHLDACRIEPEGARPDPVWRGCPVADADEDGVPDVSDTCRLQPAGRTPDRAWPGCPARDADHDDVLDDDDQCIDVARGSDPDPDRAGCPDGDVDHDAVTDHHDDCRTTPIGFHPDPSRRGCPDADADHDTVPDREDHCPAVAGAPDRDVRRNGCPGAVSLVDDEIRTRAPIRFVGATPRLDVASGGALRSVATLLAAMPAIARVEIAVVMPVSLSGESEARNRALLAARLQNVRFELVSRGVDPARVVVRESAVTATQPGTPRGSEVVFRVVDPPLGAVR